MPFMNRSKWCPNSVDCKPTVINKIQILMAMINTINHDSKIIVIFFWGTILIDIAFDLFGCSVVGFN